MNLYNLLCREEIAAHIRRLVAAYTFFIAIRQTADMSYLDRQGHRLVLLPSKSNTSAIDVLKNAPTLSTPACRISSPPCKLLPYRPQTWRHHRHPALQRTHHRIPSQQCLHLVLRIHLALHPCIRHAARPVNDVCEFLPPRVRPGGEELVCV
jgi:hypothetical protein